MAREGGFVGERLGGGVISDSWIRVFSFFLSFFLVYVFRFPFFSV